jgi:hypothetical protein
MHPDKVELSPQATKFALEVEEFSPKVSSFTQRQIISSK